MKVVGVRFRDHGRICDYDSGDVPLKEKDIVMVETERGRSLVLWPATPWKGNRVFSTGP